MCYRKFDSENISYANKTNPTLKYRPSMANQTHTPP